MLGFKEIAALASAIGLIAYQPLSVLMSIDARELRGSEIAFAGTFEGVDADGQTLVWSSVAPLSKASVVMRIVPMGSETSAAELVWPVRATVTTADSTGASSESRLFGIIDWSKQELRLHGDCTSGLQVGSPVTATGTFARLEINAIVDVQPLTASR